MINITFTDHSVSHQVQYNSNNVTITLHVQNEVITASRSVCNDEWFILN